MSMAMMMTASTACPAARNPSMIWCTKARKKTQTARETRAEKVNSQELKERHLHAAGQRRGHGADPRNKFGDEQGGASAFVERFGGAEHAVFRINRDAAQKFEDGPSGVAAEHVKQAIGQEHGKDRQHRRERAIKHAGRDGGATSDKRNRAGNRHADGFGKNNERDNQVAMAQDQGDEIVHGVNLD